MVPIKRWYNFAPKRQVAQQADVSSEDLERMVRHAHPRSPRPPPPRQPPPLPLPRRLQMKEARARRTAANVSELSKLVRNTGAQAAGRSRAAGAGGPSTAFGPGSAGYRERDLYVCLSIRSRGHCAAEADMCAHVHARAMAQGRRGARRHWPAVPGAWRFFLRGAKGSIALTVAIGLGHALVGRRDDLGLRRGRG